MEKGFVFLDEILSDVRWDAKYATWDNFTGKPVEGYKVNRIAGSYEMAEALLEANKLAYVRGYGLLLWDGYRPQRAVNYFIKWSEQPDDGITKKKYYPNISRSVMITKGYVASKSSHSRGSTIDLTLYSLDTGELVSMGSGFDFMDELSHHGAKGISSNEEQNRWILRSIMENSGFKAYDYEWWHYTLRNEPYPEEYFDFLVS